MINALPLKSSPSGPLKGTVRIPGDKSISHRSIMFGALAEGETIISGLLEGEDVYNTAHAMRALGAKVSKGEDGLFRCVGIGLGNLQEPGQIMDMGNSGTSTRLLMGIVASHNITATFSGDASLSKRPMGRVTTPLEQMGAQFMSRAGGRLPLTMRGTSEAKSITYKLPVASAQVKSAVLLAGLNAKGLTTVLEPEPTRDHSENMLRHFGIDVRVAKNDEGIDAISIEGGQKLLGCAVDVPSDPSSAAFPVVAALLNEGSELTLPRVGINPRRIGLYETLIEMGADITFENKTIEAGEPVATLKVRSINRLKGIDVPAERVPSMIDEFPVLAMAASCAEGITRMTGLAELRVKESDRLQCVAEGLLACGVKLEMGPDWLTIHGTGQPPKGGVTIETQLDHRLAMSFLVLGTTTQLPVAVDDASPVNTSFPGFVELMNNLGTNITEVQE